MKGTKIMSVKKWAKETEKKITDKLGETAVQIGAGCPHAEHDGKYDKERITWWTNGFWPGLLWLAYRASNDELFRDIAVKCEENLDEVLHGFTATDHDLGFMWILSAVADYKLTKNEQSRIRGLIAANYLMGRFNLKGGFIRAWNSEDCAGYAIIDCLMNLPLLYWASRELGDDRYRYIAETHTNTVLREFLRPDGSVNHIVDFDPATGEVRGIPQGQGAFPESAWARGTSWAIYGLALGYRYTKNDEYLQKAKNTAHFFMANLPEDYVCYWDFRVEINEKTPRDTSAAACAASGMLELAQIIGGTQGRLYYDCAVKIIRSLTESYSNLDNDKQSLINGGTGNFPQKNNINAGLIYGDYFYFEAIQKLAGRTELFW